MMQLSDVSCLFQGCSSFESQYLPTFKTIMAYLKTDDVLDIARKYEDYKNDILGPAKQKHVKSLIDKLQKAGHITSVNEEKEGGEDPKGEEITSDEEEEAGEDEEEVISLAQKIKYLSVKACVLQEYFDMTVDYLHMLPPEVLAKLVRANIWGRIKEEADI